MIADELPPTPPEQAPYDLEAELNALGDGTPDGPFEPPERMFKPHSMRDLRSMPPRTWLVADIIGPGEFGMLFGLPSAGKSFVAIDLLIAAINGSEFAGRFNVGRPLKVAYLAGEGTSGIRDRLIAALDYHGITEHEEVRITYYDDVPQLYDATSFLSADQFVAEAKADGPYDLIVIDTLHTASVGGDENYAKDAAVMIAACQRIQKALGCALFLVHHAPKNGYGPRGSNAFPGACDTVLEVAMESGTRVLKCTKLKHGPTWEPMAFSLQESGASAVVNWEGSAKPIVRAASDVRVHELLESQAVGHWLSVSDIMVLTGLPRQTVKDALARLEADGLVTAEKRTGRTGNRYQARNQEGQRSHPVTVTAGAGEINGREGLLRNSPRPFVSPPDSDGLDGGNGRPRLLSEGCLVRTKAEADDWITRAWEETNAD